MKVVYRRNPKELNLLGSIKNRFNLYAKTQLTAIDESITVMEDNPEKYRESIEGYYDWKAQILADLETIKTMKA